MVTSERSVASYRKHSARKTPEEVEGLQGVVLTPGGEMAVVNISNGGGRSSRARHGRPRDGRSTCAS